MGRIDLPGSLVERSRQRPNQRVPGYPAASSIVRRGDCGSGSKGTSLGTIVL